MKIDIRVLLIALQLGLVALVSAQVTVEGGWFNGTLWDGLLLGFNLGAAIFSAMLYKQGQLLDEVLAAYGRNIDFTKGFLEIIEKMHKEDLKKTQPKNKKSTQK